MRRKYFLILLLFIIIDCYACISLLLRLLAASYIAIPGQSILDCIKPGREACDFHWSFSSS